MGFLFFFLETGAVVWMYNHFCPCVVARRAAPVTSTIAMESDKNSFSLSVSVSPPLPRLSRILKKNKKLFSHKFQPWCCL